MKARDCHDSRLYRQPSAAQRRALDAARRALDRAFLSGDGVAYQTAAALLRKILRGIRAPRVEDVGRD